MVARYSFLIITATKVQNLFDKYNTLPIPYYILLGEIGNFCPFGLRRFAPAHHWHNAVVPSQRHSVSWSLPSPYLCSRRTILKMCFCSWYPPRCYQHRGLLPSYSFFSSGCKTTIFCWFHRYAKYSSSRNQKRVVRGALLCPILPIRLTKFNWLSKPSHGFFDERSGIAESG